MSRKGFTAGVVLCCLLIASSLVCFYAWVKHIQQKGANPVTYDVAKDEVFFVSTANHRFHGWKIRSQSVSSAAKVL